MFLVMLVSTIKKNISIIISCIRILCFLFWQIIVFLFYFADYIFSFRQSRFFFSNIYHGTVYDTKGGLGYRCLVSLIANFQLYLDHLIYRRRKTWRDMKIWWTYWPVKPPSRVGAHLKTLTSDVSISVLTC